jgi:alanyl-tRNA synthetase
MLVKMFIIIHSLKCLVIGHYFKEKAIDMAWELLVHVFKLDPNRLYATYFEGNTKSNLAPDSETQQLWRK